MALKFDLPQEEIWVKRVFLGTPKEVNQKFDEICNNKNFRNIQIIGPTNQKQMEILNEEIGSWESLITVLIAYEANIATQEGETK